MWIKTKGKSEMCREPECNKVLTKRIRNSKTKHMNRFRKADTENSKEYKEYINQERKIESKNDTGDESNTHKAKKKTEKSKVSREKFMLTKNNGDKVSRFSLTVSSFSFQLTQISEKNLKDTEGGQIRVKQYQ